MYGHFNKTGIIARNGLQNYIAFNEAMCAGDAAEEIFSDEFIKKRCLTHKDTYENYKKAVPVDSLSYLLRGGFDEVVLWFDEDMFCQINVLTILAYLEQGDYWGKIKYNLVDRQFEIIEDIPITLGGYYDIWHEVLIGKIFPKTLRQTKIIPAIIKRGIELYIELQKEDNEIIQYIKTHTEENDMRLAGELMKNFSRYGLGDIQYLELIKKVKGA